MSEIKLRDLNDYESMLVTSTCNVSAQLSIHQPAPESTKRRLREAWKHCVAEYQMLQVRLVSSDQTGPLGPRYSLFPIDDEKADQLFLIQHQDKAIDEDSLVRELQRVGTTCLDILVGSYKVLCKIDSSDPSKVSIIFSFCHALSDGPGSLRVVRSFLKHLGGDQEVSQQKVQPLIDLQALLLGDDYGASSVSSDLFPGMADITTALSTERHIVNGVSLLPPESLQNIPSDPKQPKGHIDTVHFTLSEHETSRLRTNCRKHGATIQGALTAASLLTRIRLLNISAPVLAAVQIPVDMRSFVPVDDDTCLCGSAGLWHTVMVHDDDCMELAKTCTLELQALTKNRNQPQEWLRRLFQAPNTLPPYSLMQSSIGVAPIETQYGRNVTVKNVFFFGGSLVTSATAKATMIHAVTFNGALTCMVNFTSPGVSREFAQETASSVKSLLLSMASA